MQQLLNNKTTKWVLGIIAYIGGCMILISYMPSLMIIVIFVSLTTALIYLAKVIYRINIKVPHKNYREKPENHVFEGIPTKLINQEYQYIIDMPVYQIPKDDISPPHPTSIQHVYTMDKENTSYRRTNNNLYITYHLPSVSTSKGVQIHFKPDQRQSRRHTIYYCMPGLSIYLSIVSFVPFISTFIFDTIKTYSTYPIIGYGLWICFIATISYHICDYIAHLYAYRIGDKYLEKLYDIDCSEIDYVLPEGWIDTYHHRINKHKLNHYTELYIDSKLGQVTIKYDFLKHNISDQVNTEWIKQHIVYQQELLKDLQLV